MRAVATIEAAMATAAAAAAAATAAMEENGLAVMEATLREAVVMVAAWAAG